MLHLGCCTLAPLHTIASCCMRKVQQGVQEPSKSNTPFCCLDSTTQPECCSSHTVLVCGLHVLVRVCVYAHAVLWSVDLEAWPTCRSLACMTCSWYGHVAPSKHAVAHGRGLRDLLDSCCLVTCCMFAVRR